jgi:hypothetical protein
MPHEFDRVDLDALAVACNAPPAPGSVDAPILLSGRCHPGAPSLCRERTPGLVQAGCADCARPFASFEVALAGEGGWLLHHPECNPRHAADAVVLSYDRPSGVVGVACARCGKILSALPVRRRPRSDGRGVRRSKDADGPPPSESGGAVGARVETATGHTEESPQRHL